MNETDIAPLARRLAEENNVDWRRLRGSGEGGRVVERDVLEFLARVMAGEEALDPTPEPLPDGMQAWPEEDVAAYRGGQSAAAQADEQGDDDDLFLLDDPPADDEPLIAADAAVGGVDGGVDEVEAAADVFFDISADEPAASAPVATADDDLLLAEDGTDGFGAAAEATFVAGGDEDDLLLVDDVVDPISFQAEDMADLTPVARGQVDEAPAFSLDGADDGLPELFSADVGGDDLAGAPPPVFDGLSDDELSVQNLDAPADPLDLDVDELSAYVERSAVVEEAPAAPTPSSHVAAVALATEMALVRHGQLWRRRLDDRPLRAAAAEVAAVLGVSSEVATVALLARAVRLAGMVEGALESWSWQGSAGAERRTLPADGGLRGSIEGSVAADDDGEAASLVVTDLARLDVDEAVLHLDAPLLALGRSSGDQAWLSLSGDDVPSSLVDALAPVAELLGKPIRLLL